MANSFTDFVKSIDWSKVMSGSDARNALIGSALGGAVLGGAGLAQERDPEESKFAPVGDALLGTVLGGVAGYGIPKAVQLIRDSGALAPDNDQLTTNYLGWGLGGAATGAGVFGGSLYQTLGRAKDRLRELAQKNFKKDQTAASRKITAAIRARKGRDVIDGLREERRMYDSASSAESLLAAKRMELVRAIRNGDRTVASALRQRIKDLSDLRKKVTRGYSGGFKGLHELFVDAAKEGITKDSKPMGLLRSLFTGRFRAKNLGNFATHGAHYAAKAPWWTLGLKTVGGGARAVARGGKYALGGAALGMLMHKLLGPSASDNYKN